MLRNLERPVWNALSGTQAAFAIGDGAALRLAPAYGSFAAPMDFGEASLASLSRLATANDDELWLLEKTGLPPVRGMIVGRPRPYVQMLLEGVPARPAPAGWHDLYDEDLPEMLALIALTQPGPFSTQSHHLGRFIGVRRGGRLVAMAGERLMPGDLTEISGVCTHPDFQAAGIAAALVAIVADGILARGRRPFLHCAATQPKLMSYYRSLGFAPTGIVQLTILRPPSAHWPVETMWRRVDRV